MDNNLSKKDYFNKVATKAVEGGKYDYFLVDQNGARAMLNDLELLVIRNGIIYLKDRGVPMEWKIEKYHVVKCSDPIYVCIKNPKVITGCIGDIDKEDSYFKLKIADNLPPQTISIFGAVETDECAIAFYYDGESKKSHYIMEKAYREEGTNLFSIIKYAREEVTYGFTEKHAEDLGGQNTGTEPIWGDTYHW